MHNAPAVSFPVGRSRFQAWFLSAAWLAGAAACAWWGSVVDEPGWRQGLAIAASLAAGAAAWRLWQRPAIGALQWDGQCWRLEAPSPAQPNRQTSATSVTGHLAVHLDFQQFLLLSLRPESGAVRWLWLDQSNDLVRWQAFRRAVHA